MTTTFSETQARSIAADIGLRFEDVDFELEQFRLGLAVEMEHGTQDPRTNVTDDDPLITGKIAWAHLNEFPDYYTRLEQMEKEAHAHWDR